MRLAPRAGRTGWRRVAAYLSLAGALCAASLALGGCSSQARGRQAGVSETGPRASSEQSRTDPLEAPSKPVAFGFFGAHRVVMATLGGSLLASDDGGRSWRYERHLPLVHIDVVSMETAFGTTSSSLWRTDDAGLSWHAVVGVSGTPTFANAADGWITEARKHPPPKTKEEAEEELRPVHVVWSTTNGGRTLRRISVPCENGGGAFMFASLSRVTARFGYDGCGHEPSAGEEEKALYATHDGGHSWALVRSARLTKFGYMTALSFTSATRGLLITSRGGLLSTGDGGRRWQLLLLTDDANDVSEVQPVGAHGLAALLFTGTLLFSDEDGCGWRRIYAISSPIVEEKEPELRRRRAICRA